VKGVEQCPLSDGGPGFVEAMVAARGGRRMHARVHDPLMREVDAAWGIIADGTAVIEMAAASGLVLVAADERRPLEATTYGTGELVRCALDAGCDEIIVGVGGSATTDAGAGAMQALGARLLDGEERDLPPGGAALSSLARIDLSGVDVRLNETRVRVATDVRNPLFGPDGAACVFAPQKGASEDDVRILDAALRRFAEVARRDAGVDVQVIAGAGAAGGLPAGLIVVANATVEPGFDLVAEAVGLRERIQRADIVVTGEGRLDAQSAYGKTSVRVAQMAREAGKRVIAVCGIVADAGGGGAVFDVVASATPQGMTAEEAMSRAEELVPAATATAIEALLRQRLP